jgi:CMP-N-acetylneuraminic acid synthetase
MSCTPVQRPEHAWPTVLALIPARGGSRGIPRKNIVPLAGKPLIEYTVRAALGAASLHRIVVSTDDAEIADIAQNCGAEVPFRRPDELADDTTAGLEVVLHALHWLRRNEDYVPDYVVELQPVAPLRTAADIDRAVTLLVTTGADSVAGLVETQHPYYTRRLVDGRVKPFLPDTPEAFRRQDLPTVYRLNGAILAARTDVVTQKHTLYGDDMRGYVMPPERSVDIDTVDDLKTAEFLLETCNRDCREP